MKKIRNGNLLTMECKLCSESTDEPEQIISLQSDEAIELNIYRIIKQHFGLELQLIGFDSVIATTISYICRRCCKIVTDFHELYLKVERNQNLEQENLSDNTDSDEPLATLRNELKVELTEIKLEPQQESAKANAATEPAVKRRSKRIVARCEKKCKSQPQFEYQSLNPIERDIKCEEVNAERMDIDALSDVGNLDGIETLYEYDPDVMRRNKDSLSIEETYEETTFSPSSLIKPLKKRRGRKRKRLASPEPIQESSNKKQVSRAFDEFLAENFKFSCCLCQKALSDFKALKIHFRQKHHIRGYVSCCGKKFLKRGVLVDHIHTHINPEFFKCPTCNKVAATRRCLELHMKLHEKRPERTFQCEICSKSYFRKSVFLRHIQMHAPEDQKKINCPQCEKVFVTTYMMNQHLKLVHLNLYAKVCEICGKSIRGREAFQRHQLEHEGAPKPLVECDLCGIKLTNKYGLARHMKNLHSEENLHPQICIHCSKVSPTMSAHKRHMKYVHNMQRKHACRMCEKAFKRAQDLKEHMTTHTGEVLYTCPHCPKTFNSNANMYSHRKKFHRKEWEEKRKERFIKKSDSLLEQSRHLQKDKSNTSDELNSALYSDGVE